MSLTLDPIVGWFLWSVIAGLLFALLWLVYRPQLAELPAVWRRTLLMLRFGTLCLLLLLMLRPAIVISKPDDRPRKLLILIDQSRSMSVTDTAGNLSRREAAIELLQRNSSKFEESNRLAIQQFDFASELLPVTAPTLQTPGEWTDIRNAIAEATRGSASDRVVSALLLTDGAIRTPKPTSEAALAAVQTFVEETGANVNPVAVGSTTLAAEGVDLIVSDVLVTPVTFEKKIVPVQAKVRLQGFDGREATVRLLVERPGDDGSLSLQEVPLRRGATPTAVVRGRGLETELTVDLSFVASDIGDLKLRVAIDPLDEEVQQSNNSREALVTVQPGGLRVVYFDSARWEQKFIRQINRTSQIQLDYVFVPDAESFARDLEGADWFGQDGYDVYLVGDIPVELLDDRPGAMGQQLAAAVRRGAGVGLLAGPRLAARPIRGTFAVTLPARLTTRKPLPVDNGVPLTPTPEGVSSYIMQLGGPEVFSALPPLERVFGLEPVNNVVDVLAEGPGERPLLAVAEAGRGRTLVFAAADTWLWYRAGNEAAHQRFWQQLLLWLGRKETESPAGLSLVLTPRQVDRGKPVTVTASVLDETGDSVDDASINLVLVGPAREEVLAEKVLAEKVSPGGVEESIAPATAGDYIVRASRLAEDGSVAEVVEKRFLVNASDPELDRPATDLAMLERIAAVSGGVVLTPESFDAWATDLLASLEAADVDREEVTSLWDDWPPLILLALVLTTEWAVRKAQGFV